MPDRIRLLALALLAIVLNGAALAAGPRPVDEVFRLSVSPGPDSQTALVIDWAIPPGHYLYRDRMIATINGKRIDFESGTGEVKDDPVFGPTEVYHDRAEARFAAGSLPDNGALRFSYQGCAENVLCYPPVTKSIDLRSFAVTESGTDADVDQPSEARAEPAAPSAQSPETLLGSGLLSTLAGFFGFGLLLSLTPCVFPMIPILSGMLARVGGTLSPARSFALSLSYVVAMACAYAVLGVFAAWSGANLQVALQSPAAVLVMSAIFVVLAFSMFGLFELQLPQGLASRLAGTGGRRGGLSGAAIMGFGSALIVGPCVTPPLAAALVYVTQTGDAARGSAALFAFGLGTGVPLLIFGVLGAGALPRSGPWLVRVKHVFGFVFLGLAIWMAGRVLSMPVTAMAFGALFVGSGAYLAYGRFSSAGIRRGMGIAASGGVAAAFYGVVVIAGAAVGSDRPLLPLDWAGLLTLATPSDDGARQFQVVTSDSALSDAIAAANAKGRKVLIDFSAEWCTECKLMERTVFARDKVKHELTRLALIRADVTRADKPSEAMMKRFGIVGPPSIILLDAQGIELAEARMIGAVDAATFLARLNLAGQN